jgi:hypothetical protein
LMRLAETQAAPLTHNRHQETVSTSLGLALVLSMFLDKIVAKATASGIDVHDLIAHVGAIDRLNASDATLAEAVANVRRNPARPRPARGGFFALPAENDSVAMIRAAENVAEKLALPCIVHLQSGSANKVRVERHGRAVEVFVEGDLVKAAAAAVRPVSRVVLDSSLSSRAGTLRQLCQVPFSVAGHETAFEPTR